MDPVQTKLARTMPWNEGTPRINGPRVFGARRGSPFFFPVPATGERPLAFAAEGLPEGLVIDPASGIITGTATTEGRTTALLKVANAHGADERELTIAIGDTICLTPPLGWNSWNVWGKTIDEEKVRRCAEQLVAAGLAAHGFSYVNIDDGWQGERAGPENALQPNEKFRDMKALCDDVHALGLRIGIYSTPYVTSYAGYNGGSFGPPARFDEKRRGAAHMKQRGLYLGETSCHLEDARQWAAWGMDYLKYDWGGWEVPETEAMATALKASGRDIVYSLSNSAPFERAADWARLAHCWRTTGDINDSWASVSGIGFSQDRWTPYAGPGHWNDPDMLVVGKLGWGDVRENRLTRDEQITHMTLWSLLAAPLLLGCDLGALDDFTVDVVCNDEMLAINQDPLGAQGHCLVEERRTDADGQVVAHRSVYERKLADGSLAVGLLNRHDEPASVEVTWQDLGLEGEHRVRDVWAREDLPKASERLSARVPPHGARLFHLQV